MDKRGRPVHRGGVLPICRTIAEALEKSEVTGTEMARRLTEIRGEPISQQRVSKWTQKTQPPLDVIYGMDEALGLGHGALLRAAGYVDDVLTVEDAIRQDTRLHEGMRGMMVDTYRRALKFKIRSPRS